MYFLHEINQGGGAARNTCVKNSHGDIIFCLDSDNVLVPNSVHDLICLLDASACEGACFEKLYFFAGNFKHQNTWTYKAPNNICDVYHVFSEGLRQRRQEIISTPVKVMIGQVGILRGIRPTHGVLD